MKLDIDYLKSFLALFLESENPFVSTDELAKAGYDISDAVGYFHYTQLIEKGFVSTLDLRTGNPKELGLVFSTNSITSWSTYIRLTSSGYDFALSLSKPDVFERLKELSNEPIGVLKDVGVELLKSYAKKKLGLSD
ncbi:hypothetical protein ECC69171_15810 [Escherichia coli C691-71 (14b)]|uniref:DUF2513 domain-containing protein n=1 Tax=Escherichia coli TaxID=562 RepID=UPI0005110869|nr:DUF2513 domain-containing protein [Escherichia coli]KIG25985.1 hypothetical protein ECC69171_15810 [Escherichia coli C691-71 (14b)]